VPAGDLTETIVRKLFQLFLMPIKWLSQFRLFQRSENHLSSLQIILWWEARRLFFNMVVGIAGVVTVFTMLATAMIAEKLLGEPIGWPDPPIFAIISVVLYAIAANICYTGGWISELISREVWGGKAKNFAEISFTLGVIFSFFLTLMPGGLVALAVFASFLFLQLK